jgi:hypothetical protein
MAGSVPEGIAGPQRLEYVERSLVRSPTGRAVAALCALSASSPHSRPTRPGWPNCPTVRVVPPTSNGGADGAFKPELRAIAASDPRLSLQAVETGNAPLDRERLLPAAQRVSTPNAICADRLG